MKNIKARLFPILFVLASNPAFCQNNRTKINAINFSAVQINDDFWLPQINKITNVSIPVCIDQTENVTPRIRNFEKVARNDGEKHEGIYYDDSDVYKALEAIAYSLKNHPDPKLEAKADEWIDKIAAAQQPDGYLNTYFTLHGLQNRWTDMEKHEDYNAGHLIEAAVAYYNTTGKRKFLDVAIRVADNIDSTFREKNIHWVSGHEEIELALVKLYKTTGDEKYLDLADWYLQQRGHGYGKGAIWNDPNMGVKYCQDDVPVKDQRRIEGHAVRAMYLYTGAADVGAAKNDPEYLTAMNSVWEDVVDKNMYLTGGIGSSGKNEGFGTDYELPNLSAYCETCASVGMVLWNQRMNLLTADAKYIDVLERSLYNGALDGVSETGDHFFYGNPLASNGNYERSKWFGTACCPSNISRLIESIGGYIYASSDQAIFVNLFIGSNTNIPLKNNNVKIEQVTDYPWKGDVRILVTPTNTTAFPINVRIPGWASNKPVPGNLYTFENASNKKVVIKVNNKKVDFTVNKGYAVLTRTWKKGDIILMSLPMEIKKVKATDSVAADKDHLALERGPFVYCVEQPDSAHDKKNYYLPQNAIFNATFNKKLFGGVVVITEKLTGTNQKKSETSGFTAIPYYTWANRGKSTMEVWLPIKPTTTKF